MQYACLFVITVLAGPALAATHYVDLNSPNPTSPYTNWASAAAVIQDGVDAAAAGDEVLVTNGVYATGGRAVYGTLTNRVACDKPITLRSVNGSQFTVIKGYQVPGTTNGDGAVRCAYLTNGAELIGFRLASGGTRSSGDYNQEQSGGGLWCESASVLVSNCVMVGNTAFANGGGAYGGTLYNCILVTNSAFHGGGAYGVTLGNSTLSGNSALFGGGTFAGTLNHCVLTSNSAGSGGGAELATLNNCILTSNSAGSGGGASYCTLNNSVLTANSAYNGGGAEAGTLNSCTVTGNSAIYGGGADEARLNNCIVYFNTATEGANYNLGSSTLIYCCTTPLPPSGLGNISIDPQLASASHLSSSSPCRGAGSSDYSSGTDIDGEAWAAPPSIGCDEYRAGAATGTLSADIVPASTNVAVGYPVPLTAVIEGRATSSMWDFGDGLIATNQPYATHAWATPGDYAVVLHAYNDAGGVTATVTIHVVAQPVHFVARDSSNPVAPYTSWNTAATNIQDAVDAAILPGALVLVTNGIYASGGRAVYGTMTNRVVVDKQLTLQSVNGPLFTVIQGYQVPGTTNGDAAIRCVYLAEGASLTGFTLTNGATLSQLTDSIGREGNGGGVWCESATAIASNCVLAGNSATLSGEYSSGGGGAYGGTLNNCTFTDNSASHGGGALGSTLNNCTFMGNSADSGGGVYRSLLTDCVLSANWAGSDGGGAYGSMLKNCMLSNNWGIIFSGGAGGSTLNNCTLTGNSAGRGGGGGAGNSTLNNCTLTDNSADNSAGDYGGGGAADSTLNDCVISSNRVTSLGGGAYNSLLNNCKVTANSANLSGGGACACVLNNCTISGNWAADGGGAAATTLTRCTLTSNWATNSGGGVSGGALNNCTISGNWAYYGGGASSAMPTNCALNGNRAANSGGAVYEATLNNCTITGNSALYGGGAYQSTLKNSIIYYNVTRDAASNYDETSSLDYCCTTPLPPSGVGNLDAEPQMCSAIHLSAASPCRGAGNPAYASGLDIDGQPWASLPAIGCDEFYSTDQIGSLTAAIQASYTNVATGFEVNFSAQIEGNLGASVWDFGDGTVVSNRPYAAHAWHGPGEYSVTLHAYNQSYPNGVSTTITVWVVAAVYYVALTSTNPMAPYSSWETAAANLQDAVDAVLPGSLVLVSNGTYTTGGRVVNGTITNRVAVTTPLILSSVNGPQVTTIKGYQALGATNGIGATRCVYLASGASLSGFTLMNGAADSGAGVWCESPTAVVSNCTLTANSAQGSGGGATGGTLINCTLVGNLAAIDGGGAYGGALNNCTLTGNSSGGSGGAASGGTLNDCTLAGNSAAYDGGGANNSVLNNCALTGNSSGDSGGGASGSTLTNCILSGNLAARGGAASGAILIYSILSANSASDSGGGASGGACFNCTFENNTATNFGGGADSGILNNCVLTANSAARGGGVSESTLNNCTLTGNSALVGGGAAGVDRSRWGGYAYCYLNNCIVYFNSAAEGANYSPQCTLNYCCTTPLPSTGTSNISLDPQLASASHLSATSPCRGAGSTDYVSGTDIDGEPWASPPSIGCDEFSLLAAGPLQVTLTADYTNVATGFAVNFTGDIVGHARSNRWDFGDGATTTSQVYQPIVSRAWTNVGDYVVTLSAYNDTYATGVSASVAIHVVPQPVHYVSLASTNPVIPYISWATAATNIQDAVDAATISGALVLVQGGVYSVGGRSQDGVITNRFLIDKPLTLRSVNGPQSTTIDGGGLVRCVYLGRSATVSGFTLTNGAADNGGGVWCDSPTAVVSNCTVTANSAAANGGGAAGGTLVNCLLAGNSAAANSSGAENSALISCIVTNNSGDGADSCMLSNCVVAQNTGIGTTGGVLNNCIVSFN
jgi:PKD repeat protein